jgi:hypothetical protein
MGGGGHGRWAIPQFRFGSEHVADFVVGRKDSMGYHWTLVELEGCNEPLFTGAGETAKMLRHAIKQIQDWRIWLESNLPYAQRERADRGLGLRNINAESDGLILIGRRSSVDDSTKTLRRRIGRENRIEIHTYDWLLE